MSKFKSYKSFLVDIGTSIANVKTEIKGHIVAEGWTVLAETTTSMDLIPSVGGVGNALGSDVLRMDFGANYIRMSTAVRRPFDIGAVYLVPNGSSNQLSSYARKFIISINGVQELTVDMTPYIAQTPADFAATLASQINASSNVNVRKFMWSVDPLDSTKFIARASVINAGSLTVNTGAATLRASDYPANTTIVTDWSVLRNSSYNTKGVTVDYSSGFIYYLSIHDRTINLASKTTSSYSPTVSATFIDNTIANSSCPSGCTPIELFVIEGTSSWSGGSFAPSESVANYSSAKIVFTHAYGFYPVNIGVAENHSPRTVTKDIQYATSMAVDLIGSINYSSGGGPSLRRIGLGVASSTTSMGTPNVFQSYPIINPTIMEYIDAATSTVQERGGTVYVPPVKFEDTYTFVTNATDESLHLVQEYDIVTSLTSGMSASDVEVQVASTAAFPSAGTLTIDAEIIEYTGKTATSFTGLSRGKYGTTAASHLSGANTYMITWYTKIGQTAMVAGYTRPQ